MHKHFFAAFAILFSARRSAAETPRELRIGRAGHAFDHLGGIGEQAEAAAASGATIIYASGLGEARLRRACRRRTSLTTRAKTVSEYNRQAKQNGIELSIGYLCATSIVKLDTFDKNWTDEFRAQFKTRPAEWRQQDRQGKPLASWYGGDYQPACMNNPDWRAYERAMVRYQLGNRPRRHLLRQSDRASARLLLPALHAGVCRVLRMGMLPNRSAPKSTDDIEAIRALADVAPEDVSAISLDDRPRFPGRHAQVRPHDQSARAHHVQQQPQLAERACSRNAARTATTFTR